MNRADEPQAPRTGMADERVADLDDAVLPERSVNDTDRGWGDHPVSSDDWLLAERPPHWG